MLVFEERGKPEYPGKYLPKQSKEPALNLHIYGVESVNRSQDTLVEGQCSHQCASPVPPPHPSPFPRILYWFVFLPCF